MLHLFTCKWRRQFSLSQQTRWYADNVTLPLKGSESGRFFSLGHLNKCNLFEMHYSVFNLDDAVVRLTPHKIETYSWREEVLMPGKVLHDQIPNEVSSCEHKASFSPIGLWYGINVTFVYPRIGYGSTFHHPCRSIHAFILYMATCHMLGETIVNGVRLTFNDEQRCWFV